MRVKNFGQILNVYNLDRCFDCPQWVTTIAHSASSKEVEWAAWNLRHARLELVRLVSKFLVDRFGRLIRFRIGIVLPRLGFFGKEKGKVGSLFLKSPFEF